MADLVYSYGKNLYINLTNRCPCRCAFCIRKGGDGVGSADRLWLDSEPTADEVIRELKNWKLDDYSEIVFCGYGEPFCALDAMLEVCRALRAQTGLKLRVNTNGLGDLINEKPTAPLLDGLLDIVSVSLNAPEAARYDELCKPVYGARSFGAMLEFAVACKEHVPVVRFTVVDVIPKADILACQKLADEAGIALVVRHFE